MEKLKIYNQVPTQIKFKPSLRILLSTLQKSKKLRTEFESSISHIPKFLNKKNSKFPFTEEWENHLDGSTYFGQMDKESITRQGIGKSIDIYGNYLVGNFIDDRFEGGLVLNTYGCYSTNFDSPKQKLKNSFKKFDYLNGFVCDLKIIDHQNLENSSLYRGEICNGMPNGEGVMINKYGKAFYKDVKWARIKGSFLNGKANGKVEVDLRTQDYSQDKGTFHFDFVKSDIRLIALMKNGKFVKLIESVVFNRVYHHNCDFNKISNHQVFVVDKIFSRFLYSGRADFTKFISEGRFRNIYYQSYEKRSTEKENVCLGESAYYFPYDSIYIEVEWENPEVLANGDNQFGFTRQYIESVGVMIEGNCLRINDSFISCVKTRVLTRFGGNYVNFERVNDFIKCNDEIKEESRFRKIFEKGEVGFIVNHYLDDTVTAYEELQFVKATPGLEEAEGPEIKTEAICKSDRLYYEGEVLIDVNDKRVIFDGECTYFDYEYLAKFEGVMKKDSFLKGVYTTPYCILGDKENPYFFDQGSELEKGKAKYIFTGGYCFEGFLDKKLAQGQGKLTLPSGKVLKGEWRDSVFLPGKKFVLIKEADPNQINKTCLLVIKNEKKFPEFESIIPEQKEGEETDPKEVKFFLENVEIYSTVLRQRIYKCEKLELKVDPVVRIVSALHMEGQQISLKVNPEVMKSDRDKGEDKKKFTKTLSSLVYRNSEREMITYGVFNSKNPPTYKLEKFYYELKNGLRIEAKIEKISCKNPKIFLNKANPNFNYESSRKKLNEFLKVLDLKSTSKLGVKYLRYSRYDIRILLFNKDQIEYFDPRNLLYKTHGIMLHHNGDISTGEIRNGLLHGKGVKEFNQSKPFLRRIEGNWVDDIIKNSTTFAVYENKAEYRGEMKFSKRSGKGVMRFRNGEEYNGEWFCGIKHGSGVYRWRDGTVYEGGFKLNMMWGDGKLSFSDGTCFEGSFLRNEIVKGELVDGNGEVLQVYDKDKGEVLLG